MMGDRSALRDISYAYGTKKTKPTPPEFRKMLEECLEA